MNEYSRKLCRKCCISLDQIEFYYHEWRALVDGFRDTFQMGQRNLDVDLGGGDFTPEDISVVGESSDDTTPSSQVAKNVIQTMDLHKSAILKVLDNHAVETFSALGIGISDFHCR